MGSIQSISVKVSGRLPSDEGLLQRLRGAPRGGLGKEGGCSVSGAVHTGSGRQEWLAQSRCGTLEAPGAGGELRSICTVGIQGG